MKNNVLIIGGGASGIVAAIAAATEGSRVTIIERKDRIGKKILATGNGRCNLTNEKIDISFYHGNNPEFIYGAFSRFNFNNTIEFFKKLGIYHRIEEDGKVFPSSGQASSVLDVLRYELQELDVDIICDSVVDSINKKKEFEVITKDHKIYKGDKLILATGGKASPDLGSNGSGYLLAEMMGHTMVNIFPALVQLKLKSNFLKQLQGIKFIGDAEIIKDEKTIRKESGEILFTEYGISGPPILQLSRSASECLNRGDRVYAKITLINDLSKEQIDELLIERFLNGPKKPLAFSFVGFLNKRIVLVILKEAGIKDINKPAETVTEDERESIVHILSDWRFEIIGTNDWKFAQVTAGGVKTSEVNPSTMESRKVPGLYFSGEILDIDGDCGGFNLQWAWSSGYVAGINAAQV